MLDLFIIVAGVTVLKIIVFAYTYPLTIAPDTENPLNWYYPCVCGSRRRKYQQVVE